MRYLHPINVQWWGDIYLENLALNLLYQKRAIFSAYNFKFGANTFSNRPITFFVNIRYVPTVLWSSLLLKFNSNAFLHKYNINRIKRSLCLEINNIDKRSIPDILYILHNFQIIDEMLQATYFVQLVCNAFLHFSIYIQLDWKFSFKLINFYPFNLSNVVRGMILSQARFDLGRYITAINLKQLEQ